MMADLRDRKLAEFGGIPVVQNIDYADSAAMPVINPSDNPQKLPPADVYELRLADGSHVIFRPSGTEPKAKAYVFAKAEDRAAADSKLASLSAAAKDILKGSR